MGSGKKEGVSTLGTFLKSPFHSEQLESTQLGKIPFTVRENNESIESPASAKHLKKLACRSSDVLHVPLLAKLLWRRRGGLAQHVTTPYGLRCSLSMMCALHTNSLHSLDRAIIRNCCTNHKKERMRGLDCGPAACYVRACLRSMHPQENFIAGCTPCLGCPSVLLDQNPTTLLRSPCAVRKKVVRNNVDENFIQKRTDILKCGSLFGGRVAYHESQSPPIQFSLAVGDIIAQRAQLS